MALSNYGELKTAIANWLDRSDLESKIPDFIQLAEDAIFRELRCPGNEQSVVYSAGTFTNTDRIQIPNDFMEVKLLLYNNYPLGRISDTKLTLAKYTSDVAGDPKTFGRLKDYLYFYPTASVNADVTMWYWQTQEPLVSDTDTTRTLTFAPGLYLYGALLQAQAYLIGDERIPIWGQAYQGIMQSVNSSGEEAEYAGSTVTVSNIYG